MTLSPFHLPKFFRGLLLVLLAAAVMSFLSANTVSATDLSFRKGLFAAEVKGYGMYTEESVSRFQKGTKPMVYLEVDGFVLAEKGKEYQPDLSLDLQVKDDKDNVVAGQKGVVAFNQLVKSPIHDLFFTVNLDLAEWPVGKYTLCFIVTDALSGKTAQKDMEIEVF